MSTFQGNVTTLKGTAHSDVTTKTLALSLTPAQHGAILESLCDLFTALGWNIDSTTPTVISNLLDVMIGSLVGANTFMEDDGFSVRVAAVKRGRLFANSGNVDLQLWDGTSGVSLTQTPVPFTGSLTTARTRYGVDATGWNPVIVKNVKLTAQTAVGDITSFTTPALAHTYEIGGYVNLTARVTDVLAFEVEFTDENSNLQVIRFSAVFASTAPSTLINDVGFWALNNITIAAKASTTIRVYSLLTTSGGSFTADLRAVITQKD